MPISFIFDSAVGRRDGNASEMPLVFPDAAIHTPRRMNRRLALSAAALCLATPAMSAEVPPIFKGLFEKDIPVRATIGMVVPPAEIDKHVAKVEAAARKDPEWFTEYSTASPPGSPLPFHEKLGLTQAEYDDYLALWRKREFRAVEEVLLLLRESPGGTWTLTATGNASQLSTLRYQPESDTFRSPNGELKRIEDIAAVPDSILGEWTGPEWRFEDESSLGKTKENFALGRFADGKHGLVVYRMQDISSEGTLLMDRSLVIRFALGAAGQIRRGAP